MKTGHRHSGVQRAAVRNKKSLGITARELRQVGLPSNDLIFIPQAARRKPLEWGSVSIRLHNILRSGSVKLLGDLHGRTLSEFLNHRNCGIITIKELRDFVRNIRHH